MSKNFTPPSPPPTIPDKLQPHSVEAEEAVLGSLLVGADPEQFQKIPFLESSDFFIQRNAWLFQTIKDLAEAGTPADQVTLMDELDRRGLLDKIGGTPRLSSLLNQTPTSFHLVHYAEIVHRTAIRRQLIEDAGQLSRLAFNDRVTDDELERQQAIIASRTVSFSKNGRIGESMTTCQPLPENVPVFDRNHTSHWLGLYVDYGHKVSPMTPFMFHQSAGLWLASVAIARRLKVSMPFGDVYPNLFVVWIAPTTLFRKTTALDVARRISRRVMPHLLTAQDSTPEAMLSDLAGRQPTKFELLSEPDQKQWQKSRNFCAQRGWSLDEISGLLASAGRDYNAGLIEALLRLFDCDENFTRSTKSSGLVIVKNAYLSLLGASTPGAISSHLNNSRLWAMGFWPRFAILTPETRPEWAEPGHVDEPGELSAGLSRLLNRLPGSTWPEPPPALDVTFASGVFQDWSRYNRAVSFDLLTGDLDSRLHGSYGRLPVQVLKVATILAALDWNDEPAPVIESYHFAHAVAICEKWRASAHRVLEMSNQTDFSTLQERIIRQLGRHEPQGATLRDLYKAMKDRTPDEIEDALCQLEKTAMVQIIEQKPGAKGGRRTTRYKLAR
ncbi:MAG: DUF3987 domain-containing protein [Anaerolineae bacterium]|nr:DUF3987 domain-containing protein [Anaerolineae bacterium]